MSLLAPKPFLTLIVTATVIAGTTLFGCGSGEDSEIEGKLGAVSAHRSLHPHYPVVVFGDFGTDNPPVGIAVDAFGSYIHETTKVNPALTALTLAEATEKIERTFERAIQGIRAAEATTPPPKPPLPKTVEWRSAPHPKPGSYVLVTRFGSVTHKFEIPVADGNTKLAPISPQLESDAALVVSDGLKAQNAALAAHATPSGFTLCTNELATTVRGLKDADPHLSGGPFLLTPVDKDLALRGLERSIRKLLDSTAKLKSDPTIAHLEVNCPGGDHTYEIPLTNPADRDKGVKTVLADMSNLIGRLNQA